MTTIRKSCSCGQAFTPMEWRALPFVGISAFDYPIDDDHPREEREIQELRNCPCGSTMFVSLGSSGEVFDAVLAGLNRAMALERALGEVQKRCSELLEENRKLRKLESNAQYGKEEVISYDRRSAYPPSVAVRRFDEVIFDAVFPRFEQAQRKGNEMRNFKKELDDVVAKQLEAMVSAKVPKAEAAEIIDSLIEALETSKIAFDEPAAL